MSKTKRPSDNYKASSRRKNTKSCTKAGALWKDGVSDRRSNNDPGDYNHNPALMEAAGKVTFGFTTGQKFREKRISNSAKACNYGYKWGFAYPYPSSKSPIDVGEKIYNKVSDFEVPGIMRVCLTLTPGFASTDQDPLNLAAFNLYSALRSQQTSNFSFDAPDLMLYLLAIDNMYAYYQWLLRLYRTYRSMKSGNLYNAQAFSMAMGVNPTDLAEHADDLWQYLLEFAMQLKLFPIPTDFKLFARHGKLLANIYKDSESDRSQFYLLDTDGFFCYNESTSAVPVGQLTYKVLPGRNGNTGALGDLTTVSALIAYGRSMYAPFLNSEDALNISAAIRRVYASGNVFAITDPSQTEMLDPVYNYEILQQIHNAKFVGPFESASNNTIHQDDTRGFLVYQPLLPGAYRGTVYLDTTINDPSSEQVFTLTRFVSAVTETSGSSVVTEGISGSEIAMYVQLFKIIYETSSKIGPDTQMSVLLAFTDQETLYRKIRNTETTDDRELLHTIELVSDLAKFDWAPEFIQTYEYVEIGDDSGVVTLPSMWDVDNYAPIPTSTLEQINKVALLSLFGVPKTDNKF